MTPAEKALLPYRPCVGVVLANLDGRVFAGERLDTPGAWQMPQGGIDADETPRAAALRELQEETGLAPDMVTVEDETPDWVLYDLPDELVGKVWKGRFRGQKQLWFLMRLTASDARIDIGAGEPEFARWRWMTPDDLIAAIVPFKRPVYEEILNRFRPHL